MRCLYKRSGAIVNPFSFTRMSVIGA